MNLTKKQKLSIFATLLQYSSRINNVILFTISSQRALVNASATKSESD